MRAFDIAEATAHPERVRVVGVPAVSFVQVVHLPTAADADGRVLAVLDSGAVWSRREDGAMRGRAAGEEFSLVLSPREMWIGSTSVPPACEHVLQREAQYWYPDLGAEGLVGESIWLGTPMDRLRLKRNLVFNSAKAARTTASVLLGHITF